MNLIHDDFLYVALRDLQMKDFSEEMDLKVLKVEENCKVAHLQLRQYQQEHMQRSHQQQQLEEKEQQIQKKHDEQMAQVEAQIRELRDAASATAARHAAAVESSAATDQLLAEQRKQFEQLQQERNQDQVAHQRNRLEKEEVRRCRFCALLFSGTLTSWCARCTHGPNAAHPCYGSAAAATSGRWLNTFFILR